MKLLLALVLAALLGHPDTVPLFQLGRKPPQFVDICHLTRAVDGAFLATVKSIPVAQLKGSLSSYLRCVRSGQRFLITDRGRPVALLEPALDAEGTLHQLVRQGLIRLAEGELPERFFATRLPSLRR